MRVLGRNLAPKLKYTEVTFANIYIVEYYDSIFRKLRGPRIEIVTDAFVGVQAVDVEKVD